MASTPLRIVVVDDSPLYRRTICNMLAKELNLQIVAEAEDGLYAVQAVEKHEPDVVLMDVSMPGINGLDATWMIRSKFPDVRVIILSMHDVESISEAACKAGACCCLSKECSSKEILQAITTGGWERGRKVDVLNGDYSYNKNNERDGGQVFMEKELRPGPDHQKQAKGGSEQFKI
jgi:two-component system, NarL family, response regulator DegU